MDDNIVRILISTDNHLGFMEKDPTRCDDAFASFEEALYRAKTMSADCMLLAGDMFHENKPSRRTLHGSIELLRKYCFGGDPVFIEMLNEQAEVFKNRWGTVNYEDPFQSISLPVFAIHGNHDDPSRDCGNESLSAMDLLSVSNVINYFGKADQVDNIDITPILLRKGTTMVAIYGLGAIRDERLNRMWNQRKIRFVRPPVEQNRDEFFNIFVLHQNRDYGRGAKNCIHESMIPEWMDLVVWGNEHECHQTLSESLVGTFRIYQPGSSVATSLVEGESSLANPKHMGMVEVKGRKFRMNAIPYTQVRSFVYSNINLSEPQFRLDASDIKIEEKINHVLCGKVRSMVASAKKYATELVPYFMEGGGVAIGDAADNAGEEGGQGAAATSSGSSSSSSSSGAADKGKDAANLAIATAARAANITYTLKDPQTVLVRLRVEHLGYPTVHPQRFGSQFQGLVANPKELLLFAKTRPVGGDADQVTGQRVMSDGTVASSSHLADRTGGIHSIKVEDLVRESLQKSKHFNLLSESSMTQALEDFVERRNIGAINDAANDLVRNTIGQLVRDASTGNTKASIVEATAKLKEEHEAAARKEDIAASRAAQRIANKSSAASGAAAAKNGDGGRMHMSDDEDDDNYSAAPKKSSLRKGAGRGAAASRQTRADSEDLSDGGGDFGREPDSEAVDVNSDSEEDFGGRAAKSSSRAGKGKSAAVKAKPAAKAATKRAPAAKKGAKTSHRKGHDDDSDDSANYISGSGDDYASNGRNTAKGRQAKKPATTSATTSRARAAASKKNYSNMDDAMDDSADEEADEDDVDSGSGSDSDSEVAYAGGKASRGKGSSATRRAAVNKHDVVNIDEDDDDEVMSAAKSKKPTAASKKRAAPSSSSAATSQKPTSTPLSLSVNYQNTSLSSPNGENAVNSTQDQPKKTRQLPLSFASASSDKKSIVKKWK